jgi:endogenous inhibitor of DNA gyrase (YacG/DUF329 family)
VSLVPPLESIDPRDWQKILEDELPGLSELNDQFKKDLTSMALFNEKIRAGLHLGNLRYSEKRKEVLMNCPQCGKRLRQWRWKQDWSSTDIKKFGKRIGKEQAHNKYAPFCSLRCGWGWAKERCAAAGSGFTR